MTVENLTALAALQADVFNVEERTALVRSLW